MCFIFYYSDNSYTLFKVILASLKRETNYFINKKNNLLDVAPEGPCHSQTLKTLDASSLNLNILTYPEPVCCPQGRE